MSKLSTYSILWFIVTCIIQYFEHYCIEYCILLAKHQAMFARGWVTNSCVALHMPLYNTNLNKGG